MNLTAGTIRLLRVSALLLALVLLISNELPGFPFGLTSASPRGQLAQGAKGQRGATPTPGSERPSFRAQAWPEDREPEDFEEAQAYRQLQLRDQDGLIRADGLTKAIRQLEQMRAARTANPEGAGISRNGWTWLGPGNAGGRTRAIVIHPTKPGTMWVASASGGIWKTTNAGQSWAPLDDFMATLLLSTLIIDPTNPDVLFAGTGEYFGLGVGAGVFKTTNGGTTWTQLPSTANANWVNVNRLAMPLDGSSLLAATANGFWRSTDKGANWTLVNPGFGNDVVFHPSDSTRVLAGGSLGKAWSSTDGGQTWKAATGLPTVTSAGWVDLAYSQSNPLIVYATICRNTGELWKSNDGGQSFAIVNIGQTSLTLSGYAKALWVNPVDPNLLLVGGIDLLRSTNGGASFTSVPGDPSDISTYAYVDQHVLVSQPGYNRFSKPQVFLGDDGGIYRTDDVFASPLRWQQLKNNLGITQFYGAAGHAGSNLIMGGAQDMGTWRYNGLPNTWSMVRTNDGGFCAIDPTDPNYAYGEIQIGNVFRDASSRPGGSVDFVSGFVRYNGGAEVWKQPPYVIPDSRDHVTNFITPFILDPNKPDRMLVGGRSLWRSNDIKAVVTDTTGPSWSSIKPPVTGNSLISAIVVAKGNSDILWVGYNNGDVYKTDNATMAAPTWTRVDENTTKLPNRMVTRVTLDPADPNIAYATFGGFSPDNVWRTTNGGSTWSDITGAGDSGLPDIPVYSLVVHPNQPNWIYAGTDLGLFASEDRGQTWIVPHDGPANVQVRDLFWMGTDLIAVTHGRGMYRQRVNAPR